MTGRRPPGARGRMWWAAGFALAILMISAGAVVLAPLGLSRAAGASQPPDSLTTPLSSPHPSTTSPPTSRAPTSSVPSSPTTAPAANHPPVTTARTTPAGVGPAPGYSYPTTYPSASYGQPATTVTVATTTTTTIAPLPGAAGSPVVTVPLVTRSSNGHVDTTLGWLSVGGFVVGGGIIAGRMFVTRPRRANRL